MNQFLYLLFFLYISSFCVKTFKHNQSLRSTEDALHSRILLLLLPLSLFFFFFQIWLQILKACLNSINSNRLWLIFIFSTSHLSRVVNSSVLVCDIWSSIFFAMHHLLGFYYYYCYYFLFLFLFLIGMGYYPPRCSNSIKMELQIIIFCSFNFQFYKNISIWDCQRFLIYVFYVDKLILVFGFYCLKYDAQCKIWPESNYLFYDLKRFARVFFNWVV